MYYLRSRNITNEFDKLISLLCADRLKELISRDCLDFILAQEKDDWLQHDKLAQSIDVYMATHDSQGKPMQSSGSRHSGYFNKKTDTENTTTTNSGYKATADTFSGSALSTKPGSKSDQKISKDEAMRKGLCFFCHEKGHTAKNCSKKQTGSTPRKANACTVEPKAVGLKENSTTEYDARPETSIARVAYETSETETATPHDASENIEYIQQYIDADEFHERSYVDVVVDKLPKQKALVDGGSQICCINRELVEHLNMPADKQVRISGIQGEPNTVDVVRLHVKPAPSANNSVVNIAPTIRVWFAVVPGLNEAVILTPNVVSLLKDVAQYDMISEPPIQADVAVDSVQEARDAVPNDTDKNETDIDKTPVTDLNKHPSTFLDIEKPDQTKNEHAADTDKLAKEQLDCPTLKPYFEQAKLDKSKFYIKDGLLYHHETLMGHRVNQLCLPECRVPIVLRMGHDAPFAGHMAAKATKNRIRLNFWFPRVVEKIKEYCTLCDVCQMRTPVKVADRVPITPIPRGDELPFTHLMMDCIGPILPDSDPSIPKPEYNYAIVIVDKFSRWPMAYPLRSMNAKAVCDALLQVFMTFSIPKVISSDCGSNFTSRLTQEFLRRLGCCPRFNTPGHPQASGLVKRCNQSVKNMIYKLAQSDPRGWHKLLPFVLWSLREKPSSTTHISPYTLVYGTLPKGPLSVLKECWAGERELPFNIGKTPEEYLQTLKENLELAKTYAEYYSDIEQKRYADHYNLRSTDRRYSVGDKVIVLAPDLGGAKLYSRWQGPGTIVEVKSPYSYIVEVDGKRRHVHANKIRGYKERITDAIVNNCSVIFEKDQDFGTVEVVENSKMDNNERPSLAINPDRISHLTDKQRKQLLDLLDRFSDVFSDKPGFCPAAEHEIRISPDFKPRRLRAYKVPELLKPEVDRQIKEMLELGIIVPSTSEMASPVVCVLKGPNGQNGVRLAIDYRHVNKFSAGDGFPTPDISDVLQKVGRAKYISCFDAKSGYWQIPVKKDCRWLTAFVCDAGLFEFQRMPFGLKSSGNTFMRCMSKVLHPIRSFTETFVDDMAVLSMTWSEHLEHLEKFLQTIKDSGLTLNLKKSSLAQGKVPFLGHVVGSGQIEPDPVKIATVSSLQPPTTKKEVRRLIGFFSYFRNFIPSLAETARIITDLTQKSVSNKVPWGPEHQKALDKLKSDLCNATALSVIDYTKDFGLLVDASATAVGCCLIQWDDHGNERPIAFASLKLSPTQSRWSTIEREAFAVIWSLRKFRSWIFLSKIIVFSDHNPLSFLTEAAPKSAKLARWALALQEFNIDFRYRAGRRNAAADFLSRL